MLLNLTLAAMGLFGFSLWWIARIQADQITEIFRRVGRLEREAEGRPPEDEVYARSRAIGLEDATAAEIAIHFPGYEGTEA